MEGLGLDSNEFSQLCETSLMWRSKPSQSRTWLQRWNRTNWMQHLSGRTLRPSTSAPFVEKWTSSLEATLASRSHSQANASAKTTPDTFGRILSRGSEQQDLLFASSRTWKDTFQKGSEKYKQAYEEQVTELRQEYSQRLKSARHTSASASSSLELRTPSPQKLSENYENWLTPKATEVQETYENVMRRRSLSSDPKTYTKKRANDLGMQVGMVNQNANEKNWPTPDCSDRRSMNSKQQGLSNLVKSNEMNWRTPCASEGVGGIDHNYHLVEAPKIKLRDQVAKVENYPTPTTRDGTGTNSEADQNRNSPGLPCFIPMLEAGQLDPTNSSTNGKNLELSPRWVEQLMGLKVGWTHFDSSEMAYAPTPQKKHLEH